MINIKQMIVYTFVGCPGNFGARPRTQAFPKTMMIPQCIDLPKTPPRIAREKL